MGNSRSLQVASLLLSVFIIVYVIFQMTRFGHSEYTYQTIYEQTVRQSLPVEGLFVREETVVPVSDHGVISASYAVGDKVSYRSTLGNVYQSQNAIDAQYEIRNLENNLRALEKAQAASNGAEVVKPETLNGLIRDYGNRLILGRDNEELSGIADIKAGLTEVYARRSLVMSSEPVDYSEDILSLKERLDSLKSSSSTESQPFQSTASGYFVDHIDGMEDTLNPERFSQMTASELEGIVDGYGGYHSKQSSVKIVTNHKWRYLVSLPEEETLSMSSGGTVVLRFPSLREDVTVIVEELRRDEATGKFLVSFLGDTINEYLLSTRVQAAELLISSVKGLKVPKEAIRFEDGVMGVYVASMSKMYFRKLDKLYETEDYIISRTYIDGKEGYLELYDTIIVKGKEMYDQKTI